MKLLGIGSVVSVRGSSHKLTVVNITKKNVYFADNGGQMFHDSLAAVEMSYTDGHLTVERV